MLFPWHIGSLVSLLTCTAIAQTSPPPLQDMDDDEDEARGPHEHVGDPYMPPGPLRTSVPAVFTDRQGFPPSVQVNVTASQLNILGDAANEPSMASDPLAPNRMTIGWRQFDNVASNFRQAGYAWSNDGGRAWHKSTLAPGIFRSDPVVRAGPQGQLYYNSLAIEPTYECWVYASTTGGQSWNGPTYSYGGDKQWMVVDHTSGPGHGFIYQMDSFGGFTKSMDGGLTWMIPTTYPMQHGNLAVSPTGILYGAGYGSVTWSVNANQNGQAPTFSTAGIPGMQGAGYGPMVNPGGLSGQANVGVDASSGPRQGWVYVLATVTGLTSSGTDVAFSRSENGGTTWSSPVRMPGMGATAFSGYQWFGTMAVAPNGRIDVVYNDTGSRAYMQSQLLYTTSSDGGSTWTTPAAMGPIWNSLIGWPNQDKIGDYYDMESDLLGANLAYAATYNSEQDVYFLRIGPRDCNSNGVDDATEIFSGAVFDANSNTIPDSCEIAAGAATDANGNGIPDDACNDIDFNNDGLFPDTADIEDFLRSFSGGACNGCDLIDFNHDRLFPDTADIDALLRVFSGGPC